VNIFLTYTPRGYIIIFMKKEIKKKTTSRLNRIAGQIRGLQKMIDDEEYCIDVIIQASAVRKALASFEDLMLENHLTQHVTHQMKHSGQKKAVNEIMKVYKLAKKK